MQPYGREFRKGQSGYELKLDPKAHCVGGGSLLELRPAFHKVEDLMRVLGFSLIDILAVQVAFREAAANAVRHGCRDDASGRVELRYLVTNEEVVVEVEDEGPGFDPALAPDPFNGSDTERFKRLGLFLMRAHMNWVHFNARGNRVTLGRRRTAP